MISSKDSRARRDSSGVAGVEADDGVGVAVAGVRAHADGQVVLGGDPLDALEHRAEPGAGHAHVVDHRGALDRLQRGERHPPCLEQQFGLGGVVGDDHPGGSGRLAQLAEGGEVGGGVRGVEGGQQQRLGGLRQTHPGEVVDGLNHPSRGLGRTALSVRPPYSTLSVASSAVNPEIRR